MVRIDQRAWPPISLEIGAVAHDIITCRRQ
jgi:hypothetical protein